MSLRSRDEISKTRKISRSGFSVRFEVRTSCSARSLHLIDYGTKNQISDIHRKTAYAQEVLVDENSLDYINKQLLKRLLALFLL